MNAEYTFDLHETQLNILEKCPEWLELMNVIEFKGRPGKDPAGYNEKTVFYNSRVLRRFTHEEQAFLIARQLMHIQLSHQSRGKGLDRRVWAAACETVANELLVADGFEAPVNARRRKGAAEMSAEELYDILYEEPDEEEQDLAEEGESEEILEDADIIIQQRENKDKQAGDLAGAQDRGIEDGGLASAVAGLTDLLQSSMQIDYDWFPADRIRDGMLLEQFKAYPVPHAEILLDTSASIDKDLLRYFVRSVKGLLREDAVVKVGCFDTEFYGFQEIHSEKDIAGLEIKGAGGTNFETAVKAFTGDAETKIVFTDGYADMPETRCDAIWLVYSDMPVDPPGGKVIYVKKPEEIYKDEVDFLIT